MASKKKSGLFAPVAGFRFAGMAAGIKKKAGAPDLALIVADDEVPVAAVFTTNRVKAAPVKLAAQRTKRGRARAVIVNAGNANACTGEAGMAAAKESTAAVARALAIPAASVIPASTGVIGVVLPAAKIVEAAPTLAERASPDGVEDFAHAILTTDRGPKLARVAFSIGDREATVLAIAKGAGITRNALYFYFASKEAVLKGLDEPSLKDATINQRSYPALTAMFKSEDLIEGPLAFSQKRAPKWKGR